MLIKEDGVINIPRVHVLVLCMSSAYTLKRGKMTHSCWDMLGVVVHHGTCVEHQFWRSLEPNKNPGLPPHPPPRLRAVARTEFQTRNQGSADVTLSTASALADIHPAALRPGANGASKRRTPRRGERRVAWRGYTLVSVFCRQEATLEMERRVFSARCRLRS